MASYRIVVLQIVVVLVTASVLSLVGSAQAEAALWAGVVCVPPAAMFAWSANRTRQAGRVLGQGVAKMIATVALMALVFANVKPEALGFFVAFAAASLAYVVAPLVVANTLRQAQEQTNRSGES